MKHFGNTDVMKLQFAIVLSPLIVCQLATRAASQHCRPNEYACDDTCVTPCNGNTPECSDGSDETTKLCSALTCGAGDHGLFGDFSDIGNQMFQCKYGGCIPDNFLCNGLGNCWDGSDETPELCSSKECRRFDFQCAYGGCIRRLWACNGRRECYDGSDETEELCRKRKCSSKKKFRCKYGACLEERKKCDGISDCVDDSDESTELCGAGHTFSYRAIFHAKVPEAENNPVTQPPVTQPPVTQPPVTQPPVTQPPVTQPPVTQPADPCQSSSLCTCPGSGICVPCDRVTACTSLVDGPRCSLPSDDNDSGITVNVLACGSESFVSVASYARNFETLCSSKDVPVGTVVLADCWGTASVLAQCHDDKRWHPYGSHLKENSMDPTFQLCQPKSINSIICGRRPRYRRNPLTPFVTTAPQLQWPWLAGIFRNHSYSCSATVISQDYILTAAHCVTKSTESPDPVGLESLIVHYMGPNGGPKSSFVSEILIHPGYKGGGRPTKDIALLKVPNPILFSRKVVPACVNTDVFPKTEIAATFDRENEEHFIWETFLQRHDERCFTNLDRCLTLEVQPDQFCGIDVRGEKFLPKGASGGPYLVNMGNDVKESWSVGGVVSATSKEFTCKQPFTIFTKVVDFWPWIRDCAHHQRCS